MSDGKWIVGLVPEMPAADAARIAFSARFEVVRHYLPLAVQTPYEDSEYIHQLRVGTRRAGAALDVFADFLTKKQVKSAKAVLRRLRRSAGDARDWDVFAQSLTATGALKAANAKPALDYLVGYACCERSVAQDRLVETHEKLESRFEQEVVALPDSVQVPEPPASFAELAYEHLTVLLAAFDAAAAAKPTEPQELHNLRIHGKHLRYAIEIFAPCFAPPLREKLYPAVESLQELLGGIQDAVVGVERLEGIRERMQGVTPEAWPRLRPGIAALIRGHRTKLTAARKKFQTWRTGWEKLASAYPLESLRLNLDMPTAAPVQKK